MGISFSGIIQNPLTKNLKAKIQGLLDSSTTGF